MNISGSSSSFDQEAILERSCQRSRLSQDTVSWLLYRRNEHKPSWDRYNLSHHLIIHIWFSFSLFLSIISIGSHSSQVDQGKIKARYRHEMSSNSLNVSSLIWLSFDFSPHLAESQIKREHPHCDSNWFIGFSPHRANWEENFSHFDRSFETRFPMKNASIYALYRHSDQW